jgi:FkbM family methyltransferase
MHYDFIEIGTSDFDSVVEKSAPDAVGLCVEPVEIYLAALPERPNVKKIHAAVSFDNASGYCDVYFMEPDVIADLGLPDWLRGCNSIGKPHIQHRILRCTHALSIDRVRLMPVSELLSENNVESIDLLKVDTEGGDCSVLDWFLAEMLKNRNIAPKTIIFENNELTSKMELGLILKLYSDFGYSIKSQEGDNIELVLLP